MSTRDATAAFLEVRDADRATFHAGLPA